MCPNERDLETEKGEEREENKLRGIGAVILAAGLSRRMGQSKIWLPLRGKPLFMHAVDAAIGAGLHPVWVVAGDPEHTRRMEAEVGTRSSVWVVRNVNYAEGMASSVKAGIRAAGGEGCRAVFVFLADQPFVDVHSIGVMAESYCSSRESGTRIVRPFYGGEPGHPILFDAELFGEFEAIEGDEGGRSVIERNRSRLTRVTFDNPLWGADIDTPEEYERLCRNED